MPHCCNGSYVFKHRQHKCLTQNSESSEVAMLKRRLPQSYYASVSLQAVAATWEGDTFRCGRHSRQAARNGGPQDQHPQVCPGGIRPRHDPPEQGQPQPWLCDIQLPVEGGSEPATMHFPQSSWWADSCCELSVFPHYGLKKPPCRGLWFITKPLVSDAEQWRSPAVIGEEDVNEVTFRSHVAASSKCWDCMSRLNGKEIPFILYNATAKESICQKRDLTYLYEPQKTNEWITAIFSTIAFYILTFYKDSCIL